MLAKASVRGNSEDKSPILERPSANTSVVQEDETSEQMSMLPESESRDISHNEGQEETENDPPESRNDVKCCSGTRKRFEGCLRRLRLCPCVVQECMGNQRTCRICEPRKVEKYKQLEEDYFRSEFREDIDENLHDFMVLKFSMGSPEIRQYFPLLVTNTMSALNVVRGIAVSVNTSDYYRFAIMEFWRDFAAERTVDDHELLLELRFDHVKSRQHVVFVYQRDLERYDYIIDKERFFVHPEIARQRNATKKQSGDPPFIQVWDPFFSLPNNPLADLPPDSSQDTTPEKPVVTQPQTEELVEIHTETDVVQFSKAAAETESQPIAPAEPGPSHAEDSSEISTESAPAIQIQADSPPKGSSPAKSTQLDDSVRPLDQEPEHSNLFVKEDDILVNPIFCGTIFVKQGDRDLTLEQVKKLPNQKEMARWSKKYLLLRNRKLFYVDDHENMLKLYYMDEQEFRETLEKKGKTKKEMAMLQLIGPMSDYEVYTSIKARRHHNAPHGGSIYLRKHEGSLKKPIELMFCPKPMAMKKNEEGAPDLCTKGKKLWVTAMRLAKHGAKLKEGFQGYLADLKEYQLRLKVMKGISLLCCAQLNVIKMGCFKAVLDKVKKDVQRKMGNMPTLKINDDKFERMSDDRSSKKSISDFMLPDWMEDPRVPMDFTQGVGRIVHDADEIEQIKREPKQTSKSDRFEKYESFPKHALAHGPHLTQKYYHGDLSRPDAEKLLKEAVTSGAWLLRNSYARKNCLTISYLHNCRVYHKYVTAASYKDPTTEQRIYVATLDQQLAFYDVHALTEFYRLNKGHTMLCLLTTSVKNESQRDSSPTRKLLDQSPSRLSEPIDLKSASLDQSPQSGSSTKSSPRSLKEFLSKSIQKSKQALKPKKLLVSQDSPFPSTSKETGACTTLLKQELVESPQSSSQEPSSSGISSSGGPLTPESPPLTSQVESPQPTDPPTSA